MKEITLTGEDYRTMLHAGSEHMDRKNRFTALDTHAHVYAMGRGEGKQSIHQIAVMEADEAPIRVSRVFIYPHRVIRLWLRSPEAQGRAQ